MTESELNLIQSIESLHNSYKEIQNTWNKEKESLSYNQNELKRMFEVMERQNSELKNELAVIMRKISLLSTSLK